jgi:hypothetical protein
MLLNSTVGTYVCSFISDGILKPGAGQVDYVRPGEYMPFETNIYIMNGWIVQKFSEVGLVVLTRDYGNESI